MAKVAPQAGHASHRKTNSYAQAPPQRRPAHPRVPDRGRSRAADEGRQGQPLGPPGRHDDPRGLPARPAGLRACGPALGSGGLQHGHAARPQGQAGHAQAPIRSSGTNCGRCGGFSASRSPSRPSCSLRSAEHPSARLASPAWSSGQAGEAQAGLQGAPAHAQARLRLCAWPTRGTTPAPCKPTLATATSSTRCATPSYRRRGSRISGGTSAEPSVSAPHQNRRSVIAGAKCSDGPCVDIG